MKRDMGCRKGQNPIHFAASKNISDFIQAEKKVNHIGIRSRYEWELDERGALETEK